MVAAPNERKGPLGLVVTGEARGWQDALDKIVGPSYVRTYRVRGRNELLSMVQHRVADAAVLDDSGELGLDIIQMLRMIRRVDPMLPVVIVTGQPNRRLLEDALRLAAFSVVSRPLELEELLRQVWRMMTRLDEMLR